MLLASIANLISNFKILQEICACQEVMTVFVKGVCRNLRNSNKTNPKLQYRRKKYSPQEKYYRGKVCLDGASAAPAEIGIHGKVPTIPKKASSGAAAVQFLQARCRSSRFFLCTVVATHGGVRYN